MCRLVLSLVWVGLLSKATRVRFDGVDGDAAKRPMRHRKVEGKYRTLDTGSGQYFVLSHR